MLKSVRDFLRRLFPPELSAYIPGAKLIAGLILVAASAFFGVTGETMVELPVVGEVPFWFLAVASGAYLFPETEEDEKKAPPR